MTMEQFVDKIILMFRAWCCPLIFVVGFVGNALLFITLFSYATNSSCQHCKFSIYSCFQAVFHFIAICTNTFLDDFLNHGLWYLSDGQFHIVIDSLSSFSCSMMESVPNAAYFASSYIILMFTLDRCIILSHPLMYRAGGGTTKKVVNQQQRPQPAEEGTVIDGGDGGCEGPHENTREEQPQTNNNNNSHNNLRKSAINKHDSRKMLPRRFKSMSLAQDLRRSQIVSIWKSSRFTFIICVVIASLGFITSTPLAYSARLMQTSEKPAPHNLSSITSSSSSKATFNLTFFLNNNNNSHRNSKITARKCKVIHSPQSFLGILGLSLKSVVTFVIPSLTVTGLNIVIYYHLAKIQQRRFKLLPGRRKDVNQEMSKIIVHIVISTVFVLLTLPLSICILLRLTNTILPHAIPNKELIVNLTVLLSSVKDIGYAFNFPLFYAFNRTFRHKFQKTVLRRQSCHGTGKLLHARSRFERRPAIKTGGFAFHTLEFCRRTFRRSGAKKHAKDAVTINSRGVAALPASAVMMELAGENSPQLRLYHCSEDAYHEDSVKVNTKTMSLKLNSTFIHGLV